MNPSEPKTNGDDDCSAFLGGIHIRVEGNEEGLPGPDEEPVELDPACLEFGIHLRIEGEEWCYLDDQLAPAPPEDPKGDNQS